MPFEDDEKDPSIWFLGKIYMVEDPSIWFLSNKRELGLSKVVMFILHALGCEPYIMPRYMFLG